MIRATFSGINTALSALQANQKRLDITGQNLSNMNTTGYTRQALDTSSLNYRGPVSHYTNGTEITVGFGVAMDRVTQIRDPFLDAQYRSQMQKSGYTDGMQVALDSLAKVMDESTISGIRAAFDDIQSSLENLHDPSKVNDVVYESELRTRMQNLTNLLNRSAESIDEARKQEYERLDGEGTNQNGAVQEVNDMLKRIGELNRQIKYNQVFGQPSLELMDERNVLLDELSSYVPIEVRYKKDESHKDEMDWPDDLYVDMVYYKEDGSRSSLNLVSGTEGASSQNYGSLEIVKGAAPNLYQNVTAKFNAAPVSGGANVVISGANDPAGTNELNGGSIQAGLDMLSGDASSTRTDIEGVECHSYQYYMNQLDHLARSFSTVMNELNILGNTKGTTVTPDSYLLANRTDNSANGITAANIGINTKWTNGTIGLGKGIEADGNNANDTARAMLRAMSINYTGTAGRPNYGVDLGNKTFAGYISNVSTILATDSASNQNALKTNVTILNAIQDSRDAVSGISLDEEAANMMTYMAAYNAASRLMTTLDEALNTLINNTGIVGR